MVIELDITSKNVRKTERNFDFIIKNIPEEQRKVITREIDNIRRRMRRKIHHFHFGKSGEQSVYYGFVTETRRNDDNTFSKTLRNISPHAHYNEWGVVPHHVNILDSEGTVIREGLAAWFREHLDGEVPRSIFIGGRNSRIIKDNSRNKFFYNTVEEYANSGRLGQEMEQRLRMLLQGGR